MPLHFLSNLIITKRNKVKNKKVSIRANKNNKHNNDHNDNNDTVNFVPVGHPSRSHAPSFPK